MSALDVPPLGRVATFSGGIARIPHLATLLDATEIVSRPVSARGVDAVVGWGRKPNTRIGRRFAKRHDVPFITLEDGFLRSVELGVAGAPPLSITVDPLGAHYDATRPSAIELALEEDEVDEASRDRAAACMARMREADLAKYNHAPGIDLGPRSRERVLVVDQTATDLSITLGRCAPGGFSAMLRAALAEHPDAEVLVKIHPDVLHATSGKRGNLTHLRDPRVRLLTEPCSPMSLLRQVDRVYVMSSLTGLEALIAGCEVTCFASPFYAGWGLTDDRGVVPKTRRRRRTLEELYAIAYLRYARYVDPETGERAEAEDVIEHLARQREAGAAQAGRRLIAVGFSRWKQGFVPAFLRGPGTRIEFVPSVDAAERALASGDGTLVTWGARRAETAEALGEARGAPVWRMEDGFLRSVGLGTDLHAPASLVLDTRGLYYDPSRPSDLEHLLAHAEFDDDELARAAALRRRVVAGRLSKYNVGRSRALDAPEDRRLALVVGQVQTDESIRRGTLDVRTNEGLLVAAREAAPDAWLVYKPHPDVVSGNRARHLSVERAREIADAVVTDVSLADALDAADEVHTMTSLVGFEALLRELPVHVYGQPFYAGWGLTIDRHPHPRRTRRRTLDELVAATLLRYPRYVHPASRAYSTPERIVEHLCSAPRPSELERTWVGRQLRKVQNLAREVVRSAS